MLLEQIRKGSTKTLLLRLLATKPMYGYQISQELRTCGDGYFEMKEGLLYPALHQMERDGLLRSEWRTPPGGRRRRYYVITAQGRRVLGESIAQWQTFMERFTEILGGVNASEERLPG